MEKKIILLVEDNSSDVALTKRAFEKSKIINQLIVIEDGKEALEYLQGTGAYSGRDINILPIVVLLDIKLPLLDGITVLKTIRNDPKLRRLPVVMLTSSSEESDLAQSYDNGVNGFIRKPVDSLEFEKAISTFGLFWLLVNEPPPVVK
ncbi:MAG: response regulator [Candidatus Firestonebacteria bacterium]